MRTEPTHRSPVVSIPDLYGLDNEEMLAGYNAGSGADPCPEQATRSFWHGWRVGRVDAGLDEPTPEIAELVRKNRLVRGALADGRWNGTMH